MINNKIIEEAARKLASSTTLSLEEAAHKVSDTMCKAITLEEALNRNQKIYMKCPRCNNEVEVKVAENNPYSFTANCDICKTIFGMDVANKFLVGDK